MHVVATLIISLSLVAGPAFPTANSLNSVNRETSMGGDNLGWVYGPEGGSGAPRSCWHNCAHFAVAIIIMTNIIMRAA